MEFTSVNKLFEESFKKNWDRPAISNYQGVTLHYRDVARRIEKLHIMFEECGLQKGDKVAICSRNQANWAVSFLSALTYGAVPAPLLHEFKPGNIHHLVNHSEAKILFVDDVVWEGLTESEMPAHKHTGTESTSLGNTKPQLGASATVSKETIIADFTRTTEDVVIYESAATTPANNTLTVEHGITAGGGQPHSILQPYITCYMWKRTV